MFMMSSTSLTVTVQLGQSFSYHRPALRSLDESSHHQVSKLKMHPSSKDGEKKGDTHDVKVRLGF
jgi:hypothetical protein